MGNANQPGAAWAGRGDPLVNVVGHLVAPEDLFGNVGEMPNGDLRRFVNGRFVNLFADTLTLAGGLSEGASPFNVRAFGTFALVNTIRANGTEAIPTAVLNSQDIGGFVAGGFDGTAEGGGVAIKGLTTQNWAVGAHGTQMAFQTVANGQAALSSRMFLSNTSLQMSPDNAIEIGRSNGTSRPSRVSVSQNFQSPFGSAAAPGFTFQSDTNTGFFRSAADAIQAAVGGVAKWGVDDTAVATETSLQIFDVDNAALERVSVGVADSGGVGFKLLRIQN